MRQLLAVEDVFFEFEKVNQLANLLGGGLDEVVKTLEIAGANESLDDFRYPNTDVVLPAILRMNVALASSSLSGKFHMKQNSILFADCKFGDGFTCNVLSPIC